MTDKEKKYLFDISMSIGHIFDLHLRNVTTPEEFEENLTLQRAVEREIGIIGEATAQLKKLGLDMKLSDSIINRRNTIVHQYDAAKPITIWAFIFRDLPQLKEEVLGLLAQ